ncbi:Abi family protein, partial [Bacteroides heparinolyticus]|uniref:Abi family protein n=1 Tax=Prevotella heparinolytica TaxID=28113 RepID=UPI00359FD479
FGLKKVAILENWLHAISNLRNCCAHHSRTWNRRFMVSVTLPYNALYQHIISNQVNQFVQLLHFSRLADNNFMKRPGMRYNYSANGLRFIPSIPNKQSQQY